MELEPTPVTNSAQELSVPSTSKSSRCSEANFLKTMRPKEGTCLRLSEIPKRPYPEGSTPAEITKHCMDSSYVLDVLIAQHEKYLIR